jgi:hypothetical protein
MITLTHKHCAFFLAASASAAMPVASFAASPVFVNPDTLNANNHFVLTAQGPAQSHSIDGFPGAVDGLFLYGIDNALPSLRPKLWRTQPGKTLAFDLKNKLPCTPSSEPGNPNKMRPDQTNVHLHGLVVPPNAKTGGASGTYGDNSMLVVDSINKGMKPAARRPIASSCRPTIHTACRGTTRMCTRWRAIRSAVA